jgi:hypothetical protein
MAARDIAFTDDGGSFRIDRYVWRSRPTPSPYNPWQVRSVVARDVEGQFWGGTRVSGDESQPAETEYSGVPYATREEAMFAARDFTRDWLRAEELIHQAELYWDGAFHDRGVADSGGAAFQLERYVWRSPPTKSPMTGHPVRCVVAQDDEGRFRAGTRINGGGPAVVETDYFQVPFATKEEAIQAAREITRDFLSAEAELYSARATNTKPGEELVRVVMDDGWSVSINAAEKPSATPGKTAQDLLGAFENPAKERAPHAVNDKTKSYPSR